MSFIYFLHAKEVGLVKIGYSLDLSERLLGLVSASPAALSLMRVIKGTRQTERWLHHHYALRRSHGEWFAFDETMQTIDPEREAPPQPAVSQARLDYSRTVIGALQSSYGTDEAGIDRLARDARCSVRTAENWITEKHDPSGTHIIRLLGNCRELAVAIDALVAEHRAEAGRAEPIIRFADRFGEE